MVLKNRVSHLTPVTSKHAFHFLKIKLKVEKKHKQAVAKGGCSKSISREETELLVMSMASRL